NRYAMKSIIVRIAAVLVLCCHLHAYAQENAPSNGNPFTKETQLQYKQDESHKLITFVIDKSYNGQVAAGIREELLKQATVRTCEYDMQEYKFELTTDVDVSKKEITGILGSAGYKISEYTEKVNLIVSAPQISPEQRKKQEYIRQHPELYYRPEFDNHLKGNAAEQEAGVKVSEFQPQSPFEKMTKAEKIEHCKKLKEMALENGEPVEKYDKKIQELENEIENK
ncbi:MAG: hypothetical protein KJ607_11730, partial [Bacteroidetes bacterium]|nr:hypothetical protein [Bacteroidota bacterium]